MKRTQLQWAVLVVLGVLFGGVVGCSYHNGHGGGYGYHPGTHDREDIYVHDHDYRHY